MIVCCIILCEQYKSLLLFYFAVTCAVVVVLPKQLQTWKQQHMIHKYLFLKINMKLVNSTVFLKTLHFQVQCWLFLTYFFCSSIPTFVNELSNLPLCGRKNSRMYRTILGDVHVCSSKSLSTTLWFPNSHRLDAKAWLAKLHKKGHATSIRHLRNETELESKCALQLFLGSLLGSHWSAIGQFFPPYPLVTIPEIFARVYSDQFPSRVSKLANGRRTSTL